MNQPPPHKDSNTDSASDRRWIRLVGLFAVTTALITAGPAEALTTVQSTAFESANSGIVQLTAARTARFFAGTVAALAMVWCGWVLIAAYKSWAVSRTPITDAITQVLRALAVLIITLVVVS